MLEQESEVSIKINDLKELMEIYGNLSDRNKELAMAALKGMLIVTTCDKKVG